GGGLGPNDNPDDFDNPDEPEGEIIDFYIDPESNVNQEDNEITIPIEENQRLESSQITDQLEQSREDILEQARGEFYMNQQRLSKTNANAQSEINSLNTMQAEAKKNRNNLSDSRRTTQDIRTTNQNQLQNQLESQNKIADNISTSIEKKNSIKEKSKDSKRFTNIDYFQENNQESVKSEQKQVQKIQITKDDILLQKLINKEISSPLDPFKQMLSSTNIDNEDNLSNESKENSQEIENLLQKTFAESILNTKEFETDEVHLVELKKYHADSISLHNEQLISSKEEGTNNKNASNLKENQNYVLSLEKVDGKIVIKKTLVNDVTVNNNQLDSIEEKKEVNSTNKPDNILITQNAISEVQESKALILPNDIQKVEDYFAKVRIDTQTRKKRDALIFDEKIALKTSRELSLLLEKMQRDYFNLFIILMKHYKVNEDIWNNEKQLREFISKRQLLRLKELYKIRSYKKLLKLRIYNMRIMLYFLLMNLLLANEENYKEREEELREFLSSLDPAMVKAINPFKIFSN
ncbi:hypothetical protein IJU97_01230, partial [bacterium]|nr:hypothetical protein [bacterium]